MKSDLNSRRKSFSNSNYVRKEKNNIRKLNPDIFCFNLQSAFIYQCTHSSFYYSKLKNKNIMKLDSEEFSFIKSIIQENKFIDKDQIFVLPFFKTLMEHVEKNKITLNKRDNAIKSIIKSLPKSQNISIEKITEQFNNTVESNSLLKIKKSTVHTIMRKRLNLHFKKITVRNGKLLKINFLKFSFFFYKNNFKSIISKFEISFYRRIGIQTEKHLLQKLDF